MGADAEGSIAQFKAAVMAACRKPGVSIASVALANRLNANLVRRWVDAQERSGLAVRWNATTFCSRGVWGPNRLKAAMANPPALTYLIEPSSAFLRRASAFVVHRIHLSRCSQTWPRDQPGQSAEVRDRHVEDERRFDFLQPSHLHLTQGAVLLSVPEVRLDEFADMIWPNE